MKKFIFPRIALLVLLIGTITSSAVTVFGQDSNSTSGNDTIFSDSIDLGGGRTFYYNEDTLEIPLDEIISVLDVPVQTRWLGSVAVLTPHTCSLTAPNPEYISAYMGYMQYADGSRVYCYTLKCRNCKYEGILNSPVQL